MSSLLIASALGATGLIARAIAQDDIGAPIRDYWRATWIYILGPRHPAVKPRTGWLWKYIGCHRCVAVSTAGAVFTVAWLSRGAEWFLWPALALTAAFTVSLLIDAVTR